MNELGPVAKLDREYEMVDTLELARILNVHPVTLSTWRSEGRGPKYLKLGYKVRYRIVDVEAWLDENLRESTRGEGGQ